MIKIVITDIDGVLTNGVAYIRNGKTSKSICFKDLDAITSLREMGIKIGILTGEEDAFTEYINQKIKPDFFITKCFKKKKAIEDIAKKENISLQEICYIGDGKYDVEAIQVAGIGICPEDAISEVKCCANVILNRKGGTGCLAEIYSYILAEKNSEKYRNELIKNNIEKSLEDHRILIGQLKQNTEVLDAIEQAVILIIACLKKKGQLLLCGNGGSAADAQHLATELVSRFYKERKALNAEALTVNTSTLTAVANDYNYNRIFARQIEAKGSIGDVLIGISTSGTSENILEAFKTAKELNMTTIAIIGENRKAMEGKADIIISVPSSITPRIQEMHILVGHIICEQIEKIMFV